MQVFDCEYITIKKSVNMFECMDIVESIYEGVVENSYKEYTRVYATHDFHSRKNIG